ncbi:MAG: sulfatase [Bacillota bacterium]
MKILFIDIDTLRPDHLGCYGYHRDTSPNIDKIAEKGIRFDNYYCSDAPCLPSRTSLITGQFGIHNGVVGHGGSAADLRKEGEEREFRHHLTQVSLAAMLSQQDLKTASISIFPDHHGAWYFNAGFDETYKPDWFNAEDVTPVALEWLEDNKEEDNWFLHINYWDPHTPYVAPEKIGNPFSNEPLPEWLTPEVLQKHRNLVGPHKPRELSGYSNYDNPDLPYSPGEIKNMQDMKTWFDGYDTGIKYTDQHLGEIFSLLEKQGIMEETAIIISSDHGENMGELGIYGEHGTSDYYTHRIPMIIKWPGQKKNFVDDGLHYNIDLLPTLAEMLGAEKKDIWDGESYAPTIKKGKSCGRDYLVLSQCAHVLQRSVRFDDWHYIRTYHDGFHLFPDEMLFNIKEDPHETENVARENPEVCKDAAYKYLNWYEEMMATMPYGYNSDPLWQVMQEGGPEHASDILPDYCEYLKKTGREDAIPELKKRHPEEFKDS